MRLTASFISGAFFAIGLAIAGMTRPENVIGFLDVFGDWKAELLLVMGGAVGTLTIVKRLSVGLKAPLFESVFHLPSHDALNWPLVVGSAFFGIGWGLVGLCPGPAIASLTTLNPDILLFVAAMAIGMATHTRWEQITKKGIQICR